MALALVPHAAPHADRLHIWVGVADVQPAPALAWRLDGHPVVPNVLSAVAPVLATAASRSVYTGFFEFSGLAADSVHTLELVAGNERLVRTVRTLPARIPTATEARFNVLLLSCFYRREDKTGLAGKVLSQLKVKPHLTVFAGDQVYLDLPTLRDFKDDEAWLGEEFQDDYLANWFGALGFPQVLGLAPGAFMPDDHEFWNNYPFWSLQSGNTWGPDGRDRWRHAAEATYRGFQQTAAVPFGAARIIEVDPLSILLLDTRSQRSQTSRNANGDLLGKPGRDALEQWVDGLVAVAASSHPRFPMLITGQSLFRGSAGMTGAVADYEFPDYPADYTFMIEQLERLTEASLPVIAATGDVHWGRLLRAAAAGADDAPIYEVISSPTSLVATVLVDQAKEVWGFIRGLFGHRNPWPRHADPGNPPERFGVGRRYEPRVCTRADGRPTAMRGNQAVMLRFAHVAGRLDAQVSYYPLSDDDGFNAAEQWSTTLILRAGRGT